MSDIHRLMLASWNQVKLQYALHASLYASPHIRCADRNLNHLIFFGCDLRIAFGLLCRRIMPRSLVSLLASVAVEFISITSNGYDTPPTHVKP